jgi:hypothetical protein
MKTVISADACVPADETAITVSEYTFVAKKFNTAVGWRNSSPVDDWMPKVVFGVTLKFSARL